jgi:LysM repeat protein
MSAGSSAAAAESSGQTHTVQPGETPAIIAKKYGVSVKALLAANGNVDARHLKVGQKLSIPAKPGEATATAQPATPAVVPTPATPAPVETNAPESVSGNAIAPPATPAETPAPSRPPAH